MKYTKAEAKLILFDNSDVITTSLGFDTNCGNQGFKGSGIESDCSWGHFKVDNGL